MATYDNKHWLLTNIRNSFMSTDDTGMCEIVMAGENFPKLFYNKAMEEKNRKKDLTPTNPCKGTLEVVNEDYIEKEIVTDYDPYPEMEESEDEDLMNGSYIRNEDFGPHRQRSNTAQWLDKKEQALKKAAKIKVIKWENPQTELTNEEKMQMFPAKELAPVPQEQIKSLLADQLEKCPHLPHRQYLEYAKFDGTAQLGLPTKTFKIFMTMLSEKHQNYPLTVCVIANAKVQDLIGFTCYKYSIQHPDIALGSAQNYGLCIAEDDGEVDWAFPCLEGNEPCSKFGFTCLGLVDLKSRVALQHSTAIEETGLSGAFHMFFPKVTELGHSQVNPSRHNTGGSATSEAVLNAIQAVNDDRKGSNERDPDIDRIQSHIMATEAPQYKSYRVQLLHKVRSNTPVHLGISLDRIEVEPLQTNAHKFWTQRPKYILHTIDSVAWCQIMEAKSNKTTFRLVYTPSQTTVYSDRIISSNSGFFHPNTPFKHHDFECEHETAKEIVDKINRILDLRNSPCRREYKTAKEKKLQTKRSFPNPNKHISCS